MKYLVLDGDPEGELFTFDDEVKATRCYNSRPRSKFYILYAEHAVKLEKNAGQFQKGY